MIAPCALPECDTDFDYYSNLLYVPSYLAQRPTFPDAMIRGTKVVNKARDSGTSGKTRFTSEHYRALPTKKRNNE
jgi:hypothetical protein